MFLIKTDKISGLMEDDTETDWITVTDTEADESAYTSNKEATC